MLKDNWEDTHGLNLPAHPSCPNNTVLQPLKELSDNDHLSGSSSKINASSLTPSLHDGRSLVDSNTQELIKFLSTKYGPMKMPLEVGTPEYSKLVEILKQSSVYSRGSSVDEGTNNIQNVETASLTEDKSSISRNSQGKVSSSEKSAEQLWEGSLQLSSSVTLSAFAFFKSGEKLVGQNWPDFIEVKGKVRLEAFEKYVQDLPRSRNRGLMVTSICWNEASSNIGLNGMIEVAKGYSKSSRVGFAQLLSGIDLYICPRSDPIITILAKYGFFKGMSVIDDKPGSMIGCVVWRKNRPVNPGGSTSEGKNCLDLTETQNSSPVFSSKRAPEKTESSQRDESLTFPLTLPLTAVCADLDGNEGSSSSSSPCSLVVKKRPFEDDDLPEFDFGVSGQQSTLVSQSMKSCQKSTLVSQHMTSCQKSTLVSQPMASCQKSTLVSQPLNSPKKLDNSGLTQLPTVVKKTKLFDEDDMPEWQPPELYNHPPPQITTANFQVLPLYPPLPPSPRPPVPPQPRADANSSFSTSPFQPPVSSQSPVFVRPPPQQLPPPPPRPPVSSQPPTFLRPLLQKLPPPPSQSPVSSQPPTFLRPPLQQLPPPPPPRPPVNSQPPGFLRQPQHQLQPLPPQPPVSSRPPRFPRPPPERLPPPPPQRAPPPDAGVFNSNQALWGQTSHAFSHARRPQR